VIATWYGGAAGAYVGASPLEPRPERGLLGAALGFLISWVIGYKLFSKKTMPKEPPEME
jgi:hypothetical protein